MPRHARVLAQLTDATVEHSRTMSERGAPHGQPQAGGGPRAVTVPGRKSIYTGVRLRTEDHAKAHQAAAALGLSLSGYVAELVRRDEVDDEGRPTWADPGSQLPLSIERRSA